MTPAPLIEEIEKNENRTKIAELHKKGDWRGVLEILCQSGVHDQHLLWLRPTEESLLFIANHVLRQGLTRVVSLGCGTGLFEWLLASATAEIDLDVIGVEVDENWWSSIYAPPTFIPLSWAHSNSTLEMARSSKSALLFCYFNCGPAWKDYLQNFNGSLVIVCGPIEGSGTHSDPQPFQNLGAEWTVIDAHKIGTSHDHIAIYARI